MSILQNFLEKENCQRCSIQCSDFDYQTIRDYIAPFAGEQGHRKMKIPNSVKYLNIIVSSDLLLFHKSDSYCFSHLYSPANKCSLASIQMIESCYNDRISVIKFSRNLDINCMLQKILNPWILSVLAQSFRASKLVVSSALHMFPLPPPSSPLSI